MAFQTQVMEKLGFIKEKVENLRILESLDEVENLQILERLEAVDTQVMERLDFIKKKMENLGAAKTKVDNVSKDFNKYRQYDSDALEEDVASLLASQLDNGRKIVVHYPMPGEEGGDIDALVAGSMHDEGIVVFAEAKHSLASRAACQNAKAGLYKAIRFWTRLRELNIDDLNRKWMGVNVEFLRGRDKADYWDEKALMDAYADLMVEEYGDYKILMAFASTQFPDWAMEYLTELNLQYPYIKVVSKGESRLKVLF